MVFCGKEKLSIRKNEKMKFTISYICGILIR